MRKENDILKGLMKSMETG